MKSPHFTILDHWLARMASLALLTVLVAALATTVATTAYAAPGSLNPDFGTGKSLTPNASLEAIGGLPGEPPATSGKAIAQQAAYQCPTTSSNSYSSGIMFQYDLDNPVRAAWNHADKNLELRFYSSTSALQDFVLYGTDDPVQPPQFATLFNPDRVPSFSHVYRVNDWIWAAPPNAGTRGTPLTNYPVTALGLQTIPGEQLQSPTHARDLGSPWGGGGAAVIFADEDSVTLKFTRDDSAATGYTVHIDNICTDPNLLSLYNALDNADRNNIYNPTYATTNPVMASPTTALPVWRLDKFSAQPETRKFELLLSTAARSWTRAREMSGGRSGRL